jgi:hypothetical protein
MVETVVVRHLLALKGRVAGAASLTLAAALIAACATGPVYKPRAPGETVGYTDRQLTANRYRITFSGNSATRREDVETNLLRRAAEVTLAAGYTHFVFDDRDTVARTYYRQNFIDPYFGHPYAFGPRFGYYSTWPYYAGYPGHFGYGRFGYGGFGYGYGDIRPVTSYSAYSEIVMLNPEQAADNPRAIDAQSLLQQIVPPEPLPTAQAEQPRG